ncbi:MAG: HAD family phosphatase [Clostridiales bacterium]|nr:HAD family phosphatase [Clostridiales bacterium]
MTKNIVMDMGNVLLDFDPQVPLDRYCSTPEEKELVRRELFQAPEWLMADQGLIRDCERFDHVKGRVPEQHWPALKACADNWWVCMHNPIPGALDFLRDCKAAGYGLYLLSNASDLFFTYFPAFCPLEFFDGAVISCREKILKPDPEIYRRLLERYHLEAVTCYFVDDRPDNVAAAQALGMSGHVFRMDYPAIRRELGMQP